jgi:hypothetical protein
MKITIGDIYSSTQRHSVAWMPDTLINGHLLITGDSGTGKTHNLRRFCEELSQTGVTLDRIHIFDPHGDINVEGSHIEFSQSTPYAFNPLEISADPHFGGVRRAIANFIGLIQRSSRKLGPTQEAVLRNILLDVYQMKGFNADNPDSWGVRDGQAPVGLVDGRIYLDIPFEEKEIAKDAARQGGASLQFDSGVKAWWTDLMCEKLSRWPVKSWGKTFPTIHDVIALTQFKLKQLFVGTDQRGLIALDAACRAQNSLLSKIKSTRRRITQEESEVLQAERDRAGERAKEAMCSFIDHIATGDELDDLIRYQSPDTLKSLLDRLENLRATGVCRSVTPPYDPSKKIWRYGLRAYGDDEKRMFVENLLERIFQRAIERGEVDGIRDVIIIDEAPKFMSEESDHIICRIINEARKFGIALFLVAQSPTQYPEQILAGVGCKIVLGLDPMYHRMAAAKLAIDQKLIESIRPRQLILVNLKVKGNLARWLPVQLESQVTQAPRLVLQSATA